MIALVMTNSKVIIILFIGTLFFGGSLFCFNYYGFIICVKYIIFVLFMMVRIQS